MYRIIVGCCICLAVFFLIPDFPVRQEPGVLAPNPPVQTPVSDKLGFMHNDYFIKPLAKIEMQARVLSRERYFLGRSADLSPYDLALGWGRMSDEEVVEHFNISQSGRWYWWRSRTMPIPTNEVIVSSANMHMVPADDFVRRQIKKARPGSIIKLKGYLVSIVADDGWNWSSSLTRNDTGDGACELIFVQDFEVL